MSPRSVCFIIMPFGKKPDVAGKLIDFDAVFRDVIAPAIDKVGLLGVRADEEMGAGVIHKLMYERLILSEYAIADLTIMNVNVYYELGVRHAARPDSTVLMTAAGSRLPFDLESSRALLYEIDASGSPTDAAAAEAAVRAELVHCRETRGIDSPLFQLLDGYEAPIANLKTAAFREQVTTAQDLKEKLRAARKQGVAAIDALRNELGDIGATEAGVVVDLMNSYRAVEAWQSMADLYKRMDLALQRTVRVREQYAFSLNRAGHSEEAEHVLKDLIADRGPSSETYGLLGRVYKDRWQAAVKVGDTASARGHLKAAIAAYRSGFEADWRDVFPGINTVTLMTIADPDDRAILDLAPVVRYSAERRIAAAKGDYWDYATMVEISAIQSDWKRAEDALADAVVRLGEMWEAKTTTDNLLLIAEARKKSGQNIDRLEALIAELVAAGRKPAPPPAPAPAAAT